MLVICGFFHLMASLDRFTLLDGYPRPSLRTWARHFVFLAITFVTSTIAGVLFPFGRIPSLPEADPQTLAEFLQLIAEIPIRYSTLIVTAVSKLLTDAEYFTYGLSFSLSLLFILICHEMGHVFGLADPIEGCPGQGEYSIMHTYRYGAGCWYALDWPSQYDISSVLQIINVPYVNGIPLVITPTPHVPLSAGRVRMLSES